ncbi:MAG: formyltransferase family protein [Desulfotignum sp.]|nr:formyltransferase family protein [Desulfotignum sp.]
MALKIKVGTLISGGGTNLQAIIDACKENRISADIVFTGSDTPDVKGLERAKTAGIDTFVVDYARIIQSCRSAIADADLPADFDLDDIMAKQKLVDPSNETAKFFFKSRAIAEKQLLDHILS